jgi:DNA-binding MarR family transcriptional regulator
MAAPSLPMKPSSSLHGSGSPEPEPLDLETFLPYRLSVLSNRISNAIARVYAKRFGLSIPEWRLIAVLGRFGPLSANGVAGRTYMDKVRVSRAVQRLLRRGLIERATDAADRRRSILQLSPEGAAIRAEVAPLALDIERRLLAVLPAEDRMQLDRILKLLDASADTFLEGRPPG